MVGKERNAEGARGYGGEMNRMVSAEKKFSLSNNVFMLTSLST